MGSVSLPRNHSFSKVPDAVPENNIKAEIAQGPPHQSPLFPVRLSHNLRFWTQYSWLPDVFRVKDSVSSPLFRTRAALTLPRSSRVLSVPS